MAGSSVVDRIVDYNRGRDPERLAMKYDKMRKDALAFLRGTCHLFYADWAGSRALDDTPRVWVCGDLHLENFGAYKGDNRLVYFDIADFDEALLAPCALDLVRILASAFVAARVHGMKAAQSLGLCTSFLDAYALALRDGKPRWIERSLGRALIGRALRRLETQSRAAFIAKRTQPSSRGRALRIDGKHTLAIDARDDARVRGFMRGFAKTRVEPRFFKVHDVARRIAGTGSLGLPRYTILVRGRGTAAGRFLLDLKLAAPSALAPYVTVPQPHWDNDAERVVEVQRRVQAVAPAVLSPVTIDGQAYVLRELMPGRDELDLTDEAVRPADLEALARDLGVLVAWSELRSGGRGGSASADELIDFGRQRRWQRDALAYARSRADDVWLDWTTFREAWKDRAVPGQ